MIVDYEKALETINHSDDPPAVLAAFVAREVEAIADDYYRDQRGMGWERAHTTLCANINCREHRNPWQRSRA